MESGNNPQAKSPKNALGLWQFIPSTAREWGLTSSKSFDDRKNVIKSTQTAIKYLNYLHTQLNDWNLALAAYNWGIGNVKKALKKGLVKNKKLKTNGTIDFINGQKGFLSKSIHNVKPKIRELLIFPNYLMHTAYPFNIEGERRSFSFNAKVIFKK